jgi:hypothetical protein
MATIQGAYPIKNLRREPLHANRKTRVGGGSAWQDRLLMRRPSKSLERGQPVDQRNRIEHDPHREAVSGFDERNQALLCCGLVIRTKRIPRDTPRTIWVAMIYDQSPSGVDNGRATTDRCVG